MKSSTLKAFSYFGGKYRILSKLYEKMPSKKVNHFIDVCGGSMTVGLNYPVENIPVTCCDVNGDITSFFSVLRDNAEELLRLLRLTPCSEEEYKAAWYSMRESDCKIERARCFFIRAQMGFYGLGAQYNKKGKSIGFQASTKTFNCRGRADIVSRWDNSTDRLVEIAKAIRSKVQIVQGGFRHSIPRFDQGKAFFYVDPPYTLESRTGANDYQHDFTEQDHVDLFKCLENIQGRAMVSGYRSPLMQDLYEAHGWTGIMLPQKYSAITRQELDQQKQEWIWVNYTTADPLPIERTLFNQ